MTAKWWRGFPAAQVDQVTVGLSDDEWDLVWEVQCGQWGAGRRRLGWGADMRGKSRDTTFSRGVLEEATVAEVEGGGGRPGKCLGSVLGSGCLLPFPTQATGGSNTSKQRGHRTGDGQGCSVCAKLEGQTEELPLEAAGPGGPADERKGDKSEKKISK